MPMRFDVRFEHTGTTDRKSQMLSESMLLSKGCYQYGRSDVVTLEWVNIRLTRLEGCEGKSIEIIIFRL